MGSSDGECGLLRMIRQMPQLSEVFSSTTDEETGTITLQLTERGREVDEMALESGLVGQAFSCLQQQHVELPPPPVLAPALVATVVEEQEKEEVGDAAATEAWGPQQVPPPAADAARWFGEDEQEAMGSVTYVVKMGDDDQIYLSPRGGGGGEAVAASSVERAASPGASLEPQPRMYEEANWSLAASSGAAAQGGWDASSFSSPRTSPLTMMMATTPAAAEPTAFNGGADAAAGENGNDYSPMFDLLPVDDDGHADSAPSTSDPLSSQDQQQQQPGLLEGPFGSNTVMAEAQAAVFSSSVPLAPEQRDDGQAPTEGPLASSSTTITTDDAERQRGPVKEAGPPVLPPLQDDEEGGEELEGLACFFWQLLVVARKHMAATGKAMSAGSFRRVSRQPLASTTGSLSRPCGCTGCEDPSTAMVQSLHVLTGCLTR